MTQPRSTAVPRATTTVPRATRTEWLTLAQVAQEVGTSVRTVRRWVAAGKLPAYRIASQRCVRVMPQDVDKLTTSSRIPTVGYVA